MKLCAYLTGSFVCVLDGEAVKRSRKKDGENLSQFLPEIIIYQYQYFFYRDLLLFMEVHDSFIIF